MIATTTRCCLYNRVYFRKHHHHQTTMKDKNQFLNGANVDAVWSCPKQLKTSAVSIRSVLQVQGRFRKLCLDPDFLLLSSLNVGDIWNDPHDNNTRVFRKQAYRHYILDRYGYLGKGNRKVAPSCVVTCIRRHYPSPTGVYMGYQEH